MDATEGAQISLPSPDPTPQARFEPRRTQEAGARARLRESAGAPSTSLAEASVQGSSVESIWPNWEKPSRRGKPLIGMILGVRGRCNNFKRLFFAPVRL